MTSFPQVQTACLIKVGTHLVLDSEPAGCRTGEVTLVGRQPRSCVAGQLVLADSGFLGVPLWRALAATGADLLWRVPANRRLPVDRVLRDGSWLSRIHAHTDSAHTDPVTVRMLAYQLNGTGRVGEDYRLVTSLLDAYRCLGAPADPPRVTRADGEDRRHPGPGPRPDLLHRDLALRLARRDRHARQLCP